MTIENSYDQTRALNQISDWLKKDVINSETFAEIEDVVSALENYMGMPLPAMRFIESKLG